MAHLNKVTDTLSSGSPQLRNPTTTGDLPDPHRRCRGMTSRLSRIRPAVPVRTAAQCSMRFSRANRRLVDRLEGRCRTGGRCVGHNHMMPPGCARRHRSCRSPNPAHLMGFRRSMRSTEVIGASWSTGDYLEVFHNRLRRHFNAESPPRSSTNHSSATPPSPATVGHHDSNPTGEAGQGVSHQRSLRPRGPISSNSGRPDAPHTRVWPNPRSRRRRRRPTERHPRPR